MKATVMPRVLVSLLLLTFANAPSVLGQSQCSGDFVCYQERATGTGANPGVAQQSCTAALTRRCQNTDPNYWCPSTGGYPGYIYTAVTHGATYCAGATYPLPCTGWFSSCSAGCAVQCFPLPQDPPGDEPDEQEEGRTPVVVDLSGDEFDFTGLEDGVLFDLDADGSLDRVSWTEAEADDAFLALDRNGNGWIDDGSELFGGVTAQPDSSSEDPNGFRALALLDSDGDGWITPLDPAFGRLVLWIDQSHDGLSQPWELRSLESQGVVGLELAYHESRRKDRHGNELRYRSRVALTDAARNRVKSVDVIFLMR